MALATYLATMGMVWSVDFHPDEVTVCRWIDQVRDEGHIVERAYPSGWFELFRIRFSCEKQVAKFVENWQKHSIQNGKVFATQASSFFQAEESSPKKRMHTIQDGRDFNAWLFVLAALFLYVACLEAGFHPVAAFVSGLFFLASPASVEFTHYCETDTALLVSMAFFAWLAARALRKQSVWLAVTAGAAAGFAVACKFTLFPLVLWCVVGPAAVLRRGSKSRLRWWGQAVVLSVVMLAALAAGYLLGTPALRHDPAWYREALRYASRITYDEIAINLGGKYSWGSATVLRCNSFLHAMATRGLAPLLWGLFAWTFWFRPPFRRQLAGIPWLLPLFVPFLICCCPFVRLQETLPFDMLFAFGAGLPLHVWLAGRASRTVPDRSAPVPRCVRRIAVPLVALLGLAALVQQGLRTMGMASCFALRDTRAEAQNWFHDSFPAGEALFCDAYVGQIARDVPCRAIDCGGLPARWQGVPPEKDGTQARYYVENVGFRGRFPIQNPKTGVIYPEVRRNLAAYAEDVLVLREWAIASGTPMPTFAQPHVRLVAFDRPGPDSFDVPVGHERPIRLLPDGFHLYGTDGLSFLGPQRAIHTVGKRTPVHLDLSEGPRWLVTRMVDGDVPVRVVREGLFAPESALLPAEGVVAAALVPSFFEHLAAKASAYASMRVRMRGDDQTIYCASFLASAPAEAARALRNAGDPVGALALLRQAAPLDAEGRVEAFLAAVAADVTPEPEWTAAARAALASADRLAARRADGPALGRADATLCGVPIGILDDFARIRLGSRLIAPGDACPVWLPPGRYDLTLTVSEASPNGLPPRLFDEQAADFSVVPAEEGGCLLTAPLVVEKACHLRARGDSDDDVPLFEPFSADIEITWSPVEHSLAAAQALRAALAAFPDPPAGDMP